MQIKLADPLIPLDSANEFPRRLWTLDKIKKQVLSPFSFKEFKKHEQKKVAQMNKTKVDDMLIEMISPKIKDIEERFSRGEGLDQEDINTLLLKSQYNHINHLDDKLNEVTADVASLKGEFKLLETNLNSRFDVFERNIELKISQAINGNMRWSIGMIALIVTVLKLADMFVK